jgi:hypothetical protein
MDQKVKQKGLATHIAQEIDMRKQDHLAARLQRLYFHQEGGLERG